MTSLTRVCKSSLQDALHVIFVHGLGGDARFTWMQNKKDDTTLWPSWIGAELECNVWVAGYGAALSGWTDDASHLVDLGEALFAAVQVEKDLRDRRIILVGHSLGGLVIKSGMTQAQALQDQARLALLEKIAGVVFVGTPHHGSNLATIADILRTLARTNPQVINMVRNDAWLKLLNDQFRALHNQRNFEVLVFSESKSILIGRRIFSLRFGRRQLIVDRNSSDPGLAGVFPRSIEADHFEIAKPKSREAPIHKMLVAFLESIASGPENSPSSDRRDPTLRLSSVDLPATLRSASAPLMSWPSTLSDGTWLYRPELDLLIGSLATESSSTHFLLGDPGCGKSSLLVRLAQERQEANWCVLAIKADRLPPDVLDRQALAKYLNLDTDVGIVLQQLAKSRPVLVLIDQVDALADLVVQHSARLRVLLDLVQSLSNTEGVHTVISCRTFEQKHDPALRNLDATVIRLELPEWSIVQPILAAQGLQAEVWNQDLQQMLRSPHALDIFLSLLDRATEPEALRSFQGLLEKQWEDQVLSDTTGGRRATLRHLASLMADREVLGIPLAQVEDYYGNIQALVAAGLLRVGGVPGRVEFRHQTLYEFIRARSFLEESGSLTEAVRARQGSLRIRPQLWHALGYFRGASPEDYSIEIEKLWAADLRPHLKMLLIEFLGLQTTPMVTERRLVEQSMTDQWFLPRFIGAAVGSSGWFAALLPAQLPRLMALPNEQTQMLLPMLREALHFNANEVVDLVRRYWLSNKDRDVLSWQVLGVGDVAPQVGLWLDSLIIILERCHISEWAIGHLASVVSASLPEEAPGLVAAWLKYQINTVTTRLANTSTENGVAIANIYKSLDLALEARQFRDMEGIAGASPKAFIAAVWPLLLEGFQLYTSEAPSIVIGYRHSSGLLLPSMDGEETRDERPLLRSMQRSIQSWADSDPEGFMGFVAENTQSDLLLVHRLLAMGLVRTAAHSPQHIFDYLLGDPRRFVLGPYTDAHKESIALIEVVSPLLGDTYFTHLEAALRDWRYYNDTAQQDDADIRFRRLRWGRQHRLRLLRALPADRRSPAIERLVEEEERAFPGLTSEDVHFTGVQHIGSPVSATQMGLATDADIVSLFSELTDSSAWDHPRSRMKGGAIQAGRELAELAKSNLAKVLRIIRALNPEHNEIPVSYAIRALVPGGLPAPALYSLIAELEEKGFIGAGFRRDAAYAITSAAHKEAPVPDDLIDRMVRWLVSSAPEDSDGIEVDEKESSASILWGLRMWSVSPSGNYPTLSALSAACLAVEPPRLDRWLSILERHATSTESPRVWAAMIQSEFTNLRMVDRSRAEAFVDQLIASTPSITDERSWVHFVAQSFRWASVAASQRWLMVIIGRNRAGLQGSGELVCLRHALFPAEHWSRELIWTLSNDIASEAALGVAHGVANLWHEPMSRPVVHPILLELLRSSDERVLTALSAIFSNDGLAADIETRELLDALVTYPNVLKSGRAERLPELLVKLVASEPERVCQVVHALLNTVGDQMSDITTSWYLGSEWLLDIALKLQDMNVGDRVAGSALFERMLEFNMPQAREMTLDLDKRMPTVNRPRAPVRRRSRTRARKATL